MKSTYYDVMYKHEKLHWWYKVRRVMVHNFIQKYYSEIEITPKMLDVGVGTGALLEELIPRADIYGVDFSLKAVEYCRQRGFANVVRSGAENLPFESESFDIVLALDVLEHVENDQVAIRELYRVMKTGGLLIVFVPAFMILWGITDEASHHFRRYTKGEIYQKIEKENFEILRSTYFNTFLFLPILLVRLFTRILPRKMKSEHELGFGSGILNEFFYYIFKLESSILKSVNFPFGVSAAIIAKKR